MGTSETARWIIRIRKVPGEIPVGPKDKSCARLKAFKKRRHHRPDKSRYISTSRLQKSVVGTDESAAALNGIGGITTSRARISLRRVPTASFPRSRVPLFVGRNLENANPWIFHNFSSAPARLTRARSKKVSFDARIYERDLRDSDEPGIAKIW